MEELNKEEMLGTEGGACKSNKVSGTKKMNFKPGIRYSVNEIMNNLIKYPTKYIYITKINWAFGGNDFRINFKGKSFNAQNKLLQREKLTPNDMIQFSVETNSATKALLNLEIQIISDSANYNNMIYSVDAFIEK